MGRKTRSEPEARGPAGPSPEREVAVPLQNVPTGVPGFDLAVGGGAPAGSFVVLLGDAGAGHREFAYSSAFGLFRRMGRPEADGLLVPNRVAYVSFSRPREDILGEMARLLPESPETAAFFQAMAFRDLSDAYFLGSAAPVSWTLQDRPRTLASLKHAGGGATLLVELLHALNQHGPGGLVVLDSLNSLARHSGADESSWRELLFFLEGVQRAAKQWRGLVLGLLDANVLEPRQQEALLAAADGVLRFRWEETAQMTRQRTVYVQSFRGLLPQLARDHVPKFEVSVTPGTGLEMTRVQLVMGRR